MPEDLELEQEEPDRAPTLENFLAGKPLNRAMEELARQVGEGDEGEQASAPESAPDPFDPLRALDDADRKALKLLIQQPGWEVVQRIRLRACAEAEKAATLLSQINPLSNAQKIAEGWAMLSVMREVMKLERTSINAEIAALKVKQKRQTQ